MASRLWDVHTLTAAYEWDSSGGYEDRDNVVEVGGCRNYCMARVSFFSVSCWFAVVLSLCCLQVVLGRCLQEHFHGWFWSWFGLHCVAMMCSQFYPTEPFSRTLA